MKCNVCGTEGFYQGLNTAECLNQGCMHYAGPVSAGGLLDDLGEESFTVTTSPNQYISGTAVAANLTVDIISTEIKSLTMLITFLAHGDPGVPDKKVEFFWWDSQAIMIKKKPCTLSSKTSFYVAGVDANGTTQYKTHWKCNLDGVASNGPWSIEARIS